MPTENRSSNTEMVSVPRDLVHRLISATVAARGEGSPTQREAEALLSLPAPQPHPEPIAWMVGTAIWWTKEEAERDAAEVGLPIVGLGPMTGSAPAEQHQGEPVPITSDMRRLMEAYRLGEFTAEGGSNTIESLAVESFDAVANHGHDADSYMAGFCASLYWQAAPFIGLALKPVTHADPGEVERLRAQLAELVSAVRSINFGPAHAIQMRGDDEPCYPQRKEWIEWLLELCEAASVEPSASAGSDPWLPLTAPGQIQAGDWLSFTVAGSFICAKARLIIAPGTANEEIVYNLKKNHYFCTDMAIDGTSNHKGVLVAKAKP